MSELFRRVVAAPTSPIPLKIDTYQDAIIEHFKDLHAGKSIAATPGGEVYNAIPPPNLVVMDVSRSFILRDDMISYAYSLAQFFCPCVFYADRKISEENVPIFMWQSGGAAGVMSLFGPEELGGSGDLVTKIENIKADSEEERVSEMKRVSIKLLDSVKVAMVRHTPDI